MPWDDAIQAGPTFAVALGIELVDSLKASALRIRSRMEHRSHTGLMVVAVSMAIVSLLVAIAGAAAGYVIIHRDHQRIHQLQRDVSALCNRKVVTHVTPSISDFTVHTAQGCGP